LKKTIVIVEDDGFIAEELSSLISSFGYEVLGVAHTESGAIDLLSKTSPKLVCLDVDLGSGSGFNVAKAAVKLNIPIVFITSYYDDSTLASASAFAPLGFIVKPFKDQDLQATLALSFQRKLESVKPAQSQELLIRVNGDLVKIHADEILYLQGDDNYTHIFLANEQKFTCASTLKTLAEKLHSFDFVRIHKSYCVPMKAITRISGNLIYINEKALPIGSAFRSNLMTKFLVI